MSGNLNSRLSKMEKAANVRRKGTILDGIRSIVLFEFEYLLFPDRRHDDNEDDEFADTAPTARDWPADIWDNFWVDSQMVARCQEELNRYRSSGNDPSVLSNLRKRYADYRASQYCGSRNELT